MEAGTRKCRPLGLIRPSFPKKKKKGLSEDPETESTDKGFGQQILGFGEGSVLGRLRLNFKRWSGGKQADADKRAVFREVGRVHPAMAISMITRSLPIDRRCRV